MKYRFSLMLAVCVFNMSLVALHVNESAEAAFTKVYKEGTWGKNEKGEGTSGSGARPENSLEYIAFLQRFLKLNKIQSVIDIGCGDWGVSRCIDFRGIRYTGFDVVKSVIEKNKIAFLSPTVSFVCADITKVELPSADLLVCKDVMQHLTNDDVFAILKQLPKFKHCLITNDVFYLTLTSDNTDIRRGDYRNIDLTKPPFNVNGQKVLTYQSGPIGIVKQVLYIYNE